MSESIVASLIVEVRELLRAARVVAARQVNALAVLTNFEIGRRIVQHEQGGEPRAEYGKSLLQALSHALTEEFGRGYSLENLRLFRRFFLVYQDRLPKSQTVSGISSTSPFTLGWSHYAFLTGIDDPAERTFYEIESAAQSARPPISLSPSLSSSPS